MEFTRDDIIQDLKSYIEEHNGEVPLRNIFCCNNVTRYDYRKHFSSFSELIVAAGYEPTKQVNRQRIYKLTDQDLKKSLAAVLEKNPKYSSIFDLIESNCEHSFSTYSKRFGGKDGVEKLINEIKKNIVHYHRYPVIRYGRSVLLRWCHGSRF